MPRLFFVLVIFVFGLPRNGDPHISISELAQGLRRLNFASPTSLSWQWGKPTFALNPGIYCSPGASVFSLENTGMMQAAFIYLYMLIRCIFVKLQSYIHLFSEVGIACPLARSGGRGPSGVFRSLPSFTRFLSLPRSLAFPTLHALRPFRSKKVALSLTKASNNRSRLVALNVVALQVRG